MKTTGTLTTKSILLGIMGVLRNCPEALYWPWALEVDVKSSIENKNELPVLGYRVDPTRKKVVVFGCRNTSTEKLISQ